MSLSTTTLSSAAAANDIAILVASITGFAVGSFVRIDDELMRITSVPASASLPVGVLRGQEGSKQVAHVATANVVCGLGSDFRGNPSAADPLMAYPSQRPQPVFSYSAAGAIAPVAGIHVINGTSALAMTLASPTKDQDGDRIVFVSNGKANHTITLTAGFGANTTNSDVLTFNANQTQAVEAIAANGVWALFGVVAGAASVAGIGLG